MSKRRRRIHVGSARDAREIRERLDELLRLFLEHVVGKIGALTEDETERVSKIVAKSRIGRRTFILLRIDDSASDRLTRRERAVWSMSNWRLRGGGTRGASIDGSYRSNRT